MSTTKDTTPDGAQMPGAIDTQTAPGVIVLATTFARSWPPEDQDNPPEPATVVPLDEVFARDYPTDAHFVAYFYVPPPGGAEYRLRTDSPGVAPQMMLLVIDVDCPSITHGSGEAPLASWYEEQWERVEQLPGAPMMYWTRGGYRLVWRLPSRRILGWSTYYLRVLTHLRSYGIVGDEKCKDWTHLYRLPHATRYILAPERLRVYRAVPGIWAIPDDALPEIAPDLAEKPAPAPLPQTTVTLIGGQDVIERARKYLAKIPGAVSGNGGHKQTFVAACALVKGFGLTEHDALGLLLTDYNPRCEPPWTEKELHHKVQSAAKAPGETGKLLRSDFGTPIPPEAYDDGGPGIGIDLCDADLEEDQLGAPIEDARECSPAKIRPLTDLGNAERLVHRHGDSLRYIHAWGKWLVWTGQQWTVDDRGKAIRMAQETARGIYAEASQAPSPKARAAVAAWAKTSESASRIHAMLDLAQSMVAIQAADLDRGPWLLACTNGTIDLRTGVLRGHDRSDYITKLCPVVYDPQATAPTWDAFLARVQPDPEVRGYLSRRIGYCATGVIRDHMFAVDWGSTGGNGKGTFYNAVADALGDYAVTVPANMLTVRRAEAHPTELTILFGARFAYCSETEKGASLNTALIKSLTGGDRITAHRMREDFWSFAPTHKLSVQTNHKLRIKETTGAIWRRVHLVPWTVTIPEPEQDKSLGDKLKAEAPGILAWIVRGCMQWQEQGLRPPAVVLAAVSGYRAAEDTIGQFLAECTEADAKSKVTRSAMRSAYDGWCEERGDSMTMSAKSFHEALVEHGINEAKPWKDTLLKKVCRGWEGVRLLDGHGPSPTDGMMVDDEDAAKLMNELMAN